MKTREERIQYVTQWTSRNREKSREYKRRWRNKNPTYFLDWRSKNRARVRRTDGIRRERIRVHTRSYMRAYMLRKRKHDLNYRIRMNLSCRINHALKCNSKSATTKRLLGCPIKDFIMYLESKFEVGMTWENYGKVWHVDHIMPCAIFDLTKPEHQNRCFHFSNLQPMFARENLQKGARIINNQFNLL